MQFDQLNRREFITLLGHCESGAVELAKLARLQRSVEDSLKVIPHPVIATYLSGRPALPA
jgi:hypothetical protein